VDVEDLILIARAAGIQEEQEENGGETSGELDNNTSGGTSSNLDNNTSGGTSGDLDNNTSVGGNTTSGGGSSTTNPTNPGETPYYGDVNMDGVIDSLDTRLVASYLVGNANLTAEQIDRADYNRDGLVNNVDLVLIARVANNN